MNQEPCQTKPKSPQIYHLYEETKSMSLLTRMDLDSNWGSAHPIFRSDTFVSNSKKTNYQSKPRKAHRAPETSSILLRGTMSLLDIDGISDSR